MSREKEIKLFESLYRYGKEGLIFDANIAREIEEMIDYLKSEPEPEGFTKDYRKILDTQDKTSIVIAGYQACDRIDRLEAKLKAKDEQITKPKSNQLTADIRNQANNRDIPENIIRRYLLDTCDIIDQKEEENKALKRPIEAAGFKTDGMLAVGNELSDRDNKIKELQAELRAKEDALQKIKTCFEAYHVDVFPRLTKDDWKQAAEVLKAKGLSLDRISANNMRFILDSIKEIIE